MLQRLYVHNFRCLENFELTLKGIDSALLIGKNGSGKSTILAVLEIFQKISQGINRMRQLEAIELLILVDWHLVALPVIQQQSETDPLHVFKTWLSRTIILAPIPSLMTGESNGETLAPERDASN